MATRRERVVLELEDRFSKQTQEAAAAAALLNRELSAMNKHGDKSSTSFDRNAKSVDNFSTSLGKLNTEAGRTNSAVKGLADDAIPQMGRNAENNGKQIDKLSGRLALFAQAAAVLGPALIPIGAAAVPAIAGMAAGLTVAAGAAGVAMLAFKGMGKAMTALNAYQLAPSTANLAKLQDEMLKLGPAGTEFLLFVDSLTPKLHELQNAARDGLLPGAEQGIKSLLTMLPQVKSMVTTISTTLGQLASEAGAGLSGNGFKAFFDYLDNNARPLLLEMGHTIGNFAEGIGNMISAFGPVSASFSSGLEGMSKAFADWSAGLDTNTSFQSFIDYVQKSGPQVLDLLGSLVGAFAGIAEAAAPIGAVVVPALTVLADALGSIAKSDIGTPIFAGLAAMSLLSRATASYGSIAKTSFGASTIGSIKGAGTAMLAVTSAQDRARLSASQLAKVEAERAAAVRGGLATIGKSAAMVGGLAIATTGLADGMGLTNTASMALMGTMAGPWGAAIGGGVGLVMDFAKGTDQASHSMADWNAELARNGSDMSRYASILASSEASLKSLGDSVPTSMGDALKHAFDPSNIKMNFQALYGNLDNSAISKQIAQTSALQSKYQDLVVALNILGQAQGSIKWGEQTHDVGALTDILSKAKPAMDGVGISVKDLAQGVRDGSLPTMIAQMEKWQSAADSVAGRTKGVSDAIAGLNDGLLSTAQSASALGAALDAVLSPGMDLSAATDAWAAGLRNLNADLADNGRSLTAQTDSADKNRAAIRGRVTELTAVLSAEAAAGASSAQLARHLEHGREALVKSGEAAGLSGKQLRSYLNQLGLTPKLVKTIVQANTKQAEASVARLKKKLDQYGLTRANAQAALKDVASGKIKTVQGLINKYGMTKKEAQALLRDQASGKLAAIIGLLHQVVDRTATIRVNTIHTTMSFLQHGTLPPVGSADGSTVPKTGKPYADRHLYLLADGEEVISNRHGQADRNRALLKEINANRLADGGSAGGQPMFGYGGGNRHHKPADLGNMPDRMAAAFKWLESHIHDTGKGFDKLVAAMKRDMTSREAATKKEQAQRKALIEQELSAQKQRLDMLKQERKDLIDAVKANFQTDIFGGNFDLAQASADGTAPAGFTSAVNAFTNSKPGGSATTDWAQQVQDYLASLTTAQIQAWQAQAGLGTLKTDATNAKAFEAALRKARKHGLSGGLFSQLASSGNLGMADQFANMSRAEIRQFERAFNQRNRAAQSVGKYAGDSQFGHAIKDQTREVQGLRHELREANKSAHHQQKESNVRLHHLEQLAAQNAAKVAKAINGAVSHGQKKAA